MNKVLHLPRENGEITEYSPSYKELPTPLSAPSTSRHAFAAAHVVCDPLSDVDLSSQAAIDWESTLAYRRYLWSLGFSVAEAMDTAQRGMGLDWDNTKELIQRSVAEAKSYRGGIACGAGTDHMFATPNTSLEDVLEAYAEQCAFIENTGSQIILMASRALAKIAKGPEDYAKVYGAILSQVSQPVILHWLGDMFDPQLEGYWGYTDLNQAMEVVLKIIEENASKIDGIKISLLDADREMEMRRRLPKGVKMYTGDDFNYPDLILGDGDVYSHALLGIFDGIAPLASAALKQLDEGHSEEFKRILEPTVPLSRHIFKSPTRFYKTGIVFLAYLNGHQSHFRMIGGQESMRSIVHLSELFMLADQAGLFIDPELAAKRMEKILSLSGVTA
ncbi:MAG: dihydrodipicolinate synthase family protein [Tuberibacillus sp.]